jgi:GNAT superfamily N-acetyltransferase
VNDTTVALIQGQIAGFVMVVDNEVEQIYVSELHRGEGVADLLMAEAERRTKDAGGQFEYAAAGDHGPIPVPSHRYAKDL